MKVRSRRSNKVSNVHLLENEGAYKLSKVDKIHLLAPSTILNKGDAAIYVGALDLIRQHLPDSEISLSLEEYDEHNSMFQRMFNFKNVVVTKGLVQGVKETLMNRVGFSQLFFKTTTRDVRARTSEDSSNNHYLLHDFHNQFHLLKYLHIPFFLASIIRRLKELPEPFKSLKESSAVVVLGHNLTRSCLSNSLLSYSVPKLVYKKKTIIFPISVSKFSYSDIGPANALAKFCSSFILERMDCIMLREMSSFESLRKKLHVRNSNVLLAADTAFLLPKGDSLKVLNFVRNQGIEIKKPALAVCVRGRNYFQAYQKHIDVSYFSFIHNLAAVLDTLIKKLDLNVYFVPMTMLQPQGLDDYDYQGALRVFNEMSEKSKACIINTWDMTPSEIAALLEHMDFVLTMRLHQLITASTVGVPSLIVLPAQELKAVGILKALGLSNYMVNLGASPSYLYRSLLDKAMDGFTNRAKLEQTIESRLLSIKERVNLAGKALASLVAVV